MARESEVFIQANEEITDVGLMFPETVSYQTELLDNFVVWDADYRQDDETTEVDGNWVLNMADVKTGAVTVVEIPCDLPMTEAYKALTKKLEEASEKPYVKVVIARPLFEDKF